MTLSVLRGRLELGLAVTLLPINAQALTVVFPDLASRTVWIRSTWGGSCASALGQVNRERRVLVRRFDADGSPVGRHDPVGDIEPETQILTWRDRLVALDPVQRIENLVQLIRGNDGPPVLNSHFDVIGAATDHDVDGSLIRSVLDGIADHV